jgi:hypothetical protein
LEEQLKAAQDQLKAATDSSDASRMIRELTQTKNTMVAAITSLNDKHNAQMAKHRSVDGMLLSGGSSELTPQATGTSSSPEKTVSEESDARRLAKFMDSTFACSGKKEVLQAAFTAFFDEKPLDVTDGGKYAPKSVLLIHQVEIPQLGGNSARAVTPPTARDPSDETQPPPAYFRGEKARPPEERPTRRRPSQLATAPTRRRPLSSNNSTRARRWPWRVPRHCWWRSRSRRRRERGGRCAAEGSGRRASGPA